MKQGALSNKAKTGSSASRQTAIILPKLMVNAPGDGYEQEADAMAERVMRMPAEQAATKPSTGLIARSIQRKSDSGGGFQASPGLVSQLGGSKGGGTPLPNGTRNFMENAFSTDFSQVRVHISGQAAEMSRGIQAKAFTHGSDIYFNYGQYDTHSQEGKGLLAHELTHTVQQASDQCLQRKADDFDVVNEGAVKRALGSYYPKYFGTVFTPEVIFKMQAVLNEKAGPCPITGLIEFDTVLAVGRYQRDVLKSLKPDFRAGAMTMNSLLGGTLADWKAKFLKKGGKHVAGGTQVGVKNEAQHQEYMLLDMLAATESGSAGYAAINVWDSAKLTYGKYQTVLGFGNIGKIVQRFCDIVDKEGAKASPAAKSLRDQFKAPASDLRAEGQSYLKLALNARQVTKYQKTEINMWLAEDRKFMNLLVQASQLPEMAQAQDQFHIKDFMVGAQQAVDKAGIKSILGRYCIYRAENHSPAERVAGMKQANSSVGAYKTGDHNEWEKNFLLAFNEGAAAYLDRITEPQDDLDVTKVANRKIRDWIREKLNKLVEAKKFDAEPDFALPLLEGQATVKGMKERRDGSAYKGSGGSDFSKTRAGVTPGKKDMRQNSAIENRFKDRKAAPANLPLQQESLFSKFASMMGSLDKWLLGNATQSWGWFMWGGSLSGEGSTATKASKDVVYWNKESVDLKELFEIMEALTATVSEKEEMFATLRKFKENPDEARQVFFEWVQKFEEAVEKLSKDAKAFAEWKKRFQDALKKLREKTAKKKESPKGKKETMVVDKKTGIKEKDSKPAHAPRLIESYVYYEPQMYAPSRAWYKDVYESNIIEYRESVPGNSFYTRKVTPEQESWLLTCPWEKNNKK